ncbi:MAG: hypothetical protein QCI82_11635, partial [Candidatus Thermoplasmatota archaeon]|nr:hypothetical protein [Candidatus Thermoplasmatota archaeon]
DSIRVESEKITFYQGDIVEVNISLIDRDGDPIPDAVLSFDSDERLSLSYSQGSLTLLSEVPGGYAVSISCSYYGSDFEKSIDVDVLERTVMTDVILDRIEGEKYRIIALDQNGNDIASLCTIEIEGDHNKMDHSSFEALSGKVTAHVSYNGTSISREIVVDVVTNGEIPLAMILLVVGSILVLIIVGILLIARRRGSQPRRSEGSKEE